MVKNKATAINIETPDLTAGENAIITITGNILSSYSPDYFTKLNSFVYVDGVKINSFLDLNLGILRPDLATIYPNYQYADKCGFKYNLYVGSLKNGNHTVKLVFNGIVKEFTIIVNNSNNVAENYYGASAYEVSLQKNTEYIQKSLAKMNPGLIEINSGISDISSALRVSLFDSFPFDISFDDIEFEFDLNGDGIIDSEENLNDNYHAFLEGDFSNIATGIVTLIEGKYSSEDPNWITAGSGITAGFFDIDALGDVRDLIHDTQYWEFSWSHAGETALDLVGVLPIVGVLKYGDEIGVILKQEDELKVVKIEYKSIKGSAETGAKIGTNLGKLGVVAQNPGIKVDWSAFAEHGLKRMTERGVTKEMVDTWVKTGKAVAQNGGQKFLFVTEEGVAVVSKDGKLVTTYSKEFFDDNMKTIVKQILGN